MARRQVASGSGRILMILALLLLLLPLISAVESSSSTIESESVSSPFSSVTSATPHAPISITSNADFESQGWPGSGSIDDPFVIEGLFIRIEEGSCISVYKTDAYFVIRDCILDVEEPDDGWTSGVLLERVLHARVENCNISRVAYGIKMIKSLECHVSDNILDLAKNGIEVDRVYNCSIIDNHVIGRKYGIHILKSNLLTAFENHVNGADVGILVEDTHDSFIRENIVADSDWASYFYSCTNTEIMSNIFIGGQVGLDIEYSSSCLVSENVIHHAGYGAYSYSSTDCEFTRNLVHSNTIAAFYLGRSNMCFLTRNIIERNTGVGVHLQESTDCWVYGNEIGWNTKGNAKDLAGSPLAASLNHWDDEIGLGNGWSEFAFTMTYSVPGDCNAADKYPSAILAVIGPDIFNLEVGIDGILQWNASAIWPEYFEIQMEDIIIASGAWNGKDVNAELMGLDIGIYHCSLFVNTTSGRSKTDFVTVVVADRTSPVWTIQPSSQELELGSRFDYSVAAIDSFGIAKYWINDTARFDIDSIGRITDRHVLALGTYGLELRAFDPSDNHCTASIQVVVKDTVKPVVIEPGDITFVEGEAAPEIVWYAEDLSPVKFEVFKNETLVAGGHLSGEDYTIRVSVGELSAGVYDFVLLLTDEGGNRIEDHVTVEVLEPKTKTSITTTPTTTKTETQTTDTSTTTSGTTTQRLGDLSMYAVSLGIGITLAVVIVVMFLQRRGINSVGGR